jgi:hypothetical protein
MLLHDVFDALDDYYEFDSIEPNSKKHRNIEKIRFGSSLFSTKGSASAVSRLSQFSNFFKNFSHFPI